MSPRTLRRAGVRALAGASLLSLTGCGALIDEPQHDTPAEQRPGTWVRRLEGEVERLRGAYDDMVVRATPAQRRRLPSIGSELSRLADAAASMKDDLDWRRGRFGDHLGSAESVATSIDQQLRGAPVTAAVRSHWRDTTYALGIVRELYRTLGPERLYQAHGDPRGVLHLRTAASTPEKARRVVRSGARGDDEMITASRATPARRAAAAGSAALD